MPVLETKLPVCSALPRTILRQSLLSEGEFANNRKQPGMPSGTCLSTAQAVRV